MRNYTFHLMLFVLAVFIQLNTVSQAFAQINGGTASLKVGENVMLSIPVPYPARATNIVYNWTLEKSAVVFISNKTTMSCIVNGKGPGECRVNYQGSYRLDGYYRTMNFYFDITVQPNGPTMIEVSPKTVSMDEDQMCTLNATLSGGSATVNWSSSNNNVVTVWGNGLSVDVFPVKEGTAYVYARTSNGLSDYCTVTVKKKNVIPTQISLLDSIEIEVGRSKTLTPIFIPEGTTCNLTWSSEDENIAVVDEITGEVMGRCIGTTTIRCVSDDGKLVASCEVTVFIKTDKLFYVENVTLPKYGVANLVLKPRYNMTGNFVFSFGIKLPIGIGFTDGRACYDNSLNIKTTTNHVTSNTQIGVIEKVYLTGLANPLTLINDSTLFTFIIRDIGLSDVGSTLEANLADVYIQINSGPYYHTFLDNVVNSFTITIDEPDGNLSGITEREYISSNKTFNLQGSPVTKPSKGLYIVNGKKVVMEH